MSWSKHIVKWNETSSKLSQKRVYYVTIKFFLSQAYREAFEYLLEEFKTYKPLLSAIKNEYEMMLAAQNQKIRELEPLKVS